MRWMLIALSLLACFGLGKAVPGEAKKPAVKPVGQAEAQDYGQQVYLFVDGIAKQYVRPVSPEKLVAAAVQGLYEAAGAPVPKEFQGNLADRDLHSILTNARKMAGDVEAIRGDNGIRVSLQGMMRVLDPYSAYVPAEEHVRVNPFEGSQVGVGLVLEERKGPGPLIVRSVTFGGPAQRAGLRPGEELLTIDGDSTESLSAAQAVGRLNGEPGTTIVLTLRRQGEKQAREIKLVRAIFREETVLGMARRANTEWDFLLDHRKKIGLTRLTAINSGTAAEFYQALLGLHRAELRGLVLDLRECPGGYLEEAIGIADLFLEDGIIATHKGRDSEDPRTHPRDTVGGLAWVQEHNFLRFPVIALIGPETSGGGELIAAALQDHKRALIAGQRTRGKASVQTMVGHHNQSHRVKLTTGEFVRPNGKNLHRFPESKPWHDWGVQPDADLEVRISPDLRKQIRQWRLLHDLRPADSREALPLDKPEADPVLFAALSHLRKSIH